MRVCVTWNDVKSIKVRRLFLLFFLLIEVMTITLFLCSVSAREHEWVIMRRMAWTVAFLYYCNIIKFFFFFVCPPAKFQRKAQLHQRFSSTQLTSKVKFISWSEAMNIVYIFKTNSHNHGTATGWMLYWSHVFIEFKFKNWTKKRPS